MSACATHRLARNTTALSVEQENGDATKEPSDEDYDKASAAKAEAMDAQGEGDWEKATGLWTVVISPAVFLPFYCWAQVPGVSGCCAPYGSRG